jgi:hypothetical protein
MKHIFCSYILTIENTWIVNYYGKGPFVYVYYSTKFSNLLRDLRKRLDVVNQKYSIGFQFAICDIRLGNTM